MRNLEQVIIPASVTFFGEDNFNGCDALRQVEFLGKVEEIVSNGCFQNCSSLEKIFVPAEYVDYYKQAFPSVADKIFQAQ